MRLWFHLDGIWLCAPPKCGGTALYRHALKIDAPDRATFSQAAEATAFYGPDGIGRPAFLAVRDPVERFMSLWRDKCRNGDDNLPKLRGLTPTQLMTVIEGDWHGDPHWAPQAAHYRPGVTCMPYQDMLRWFTPPTPAAVVNYTVRDYRDPPAPVARILAHYWKDMELVYG